VSWSDSKVYVDLYREEIKNSPEYLDSMSVDREYEQRLWDHYKRSAYWIPRAELPHSPMVSKD